MTPIYIIVAVIIALGLGAMLMLGGFFFWHLLQTMKAVRESIGEFVKVMEPLVKTGALEQLSKSASGIFQVGRQIATLIPDVNETFKVFNRTLLKTAATEPTPFSEKSPAATPAPSESIKVSYTEEQMYEQERAAKLRAQGIETDATRVIEPGQKEMTGAQV